MTVFYQERMWIPSKVQPAFFASVRQDYIPIAAALGAEPLGMWRLSSIKGDAAEVVLIWSFSGWLELIAFTEAASDPTSPLAVWHEKSWQWIRNREGMILRQRVDADLVERLRQGASSLYCFHETMDVQSNMEDDYVNGIELQLGQGQHNVGLNMVGIFQPAFQSNLIINLWAVERGLGNIVKGIGDTDPDEFFDGGYWMDMAIGLREHWRSVWLLPVPLDA